MKNRDKRLFVGLIIWSVLLLSFHSCSFGNPKTAKEEQRKKELENSKYVYVDKVGILHYDNDCYMIDMVDQDNEGNIKFTGASIKRISKDGIPSGLFEKCCSKCISDEIYEGLLKRSSARKVAPWVKK